MNLMFAKLFSFLNIDCAELLFGGSLPGENESLH